MKNILLILFFFFHSVVVSLHDRLLRACYISDVDQVKFLLNELESGIRQTGVVPIVVNRLDPIYKRTSLLQCGFDPQSNSIDEVDSNCTQIAQLLAQHGANLSHVDKYGWNGIAIGSTTGMIKYTEYLLNQNVSIDSCDVNGRTPLMKAITHGHLNVVKLLLNRGANISIIDNYGWSIFHFVITQLKNNKNLYLPIFETLLLAAKFSFHSPNTTTIPNTTNINIINSQDKDGRTPLMYAILNDLIECIPLLLQYDSDPRIIDNYQQTSLQMTRNERIKELLLEGLINITRKEHQEYIDQINHKLEKLNNLQEYQEEIDL